MKENQTPIGILGGGPAGIYTSLELAKLGIPSTVIDPFQSEGSRVIEHVRTTPVIESHLARRWGIPFTSDLSQVDVNVGSLLVRSVILGSARRLHTPRVSVDIFTLTDTLLSQARADESGLISMERGRFRQVVLDGSTISGVRLDCGEASFQFYIDATGRSGFVGEAVRRLHPELIISESADQPSTVIGGYAHFNESLREMRAFSDPATVYTGIFKHGLTGFFINSLPSLHKDNWGTHLLLLEGNPQIIINALKNCGNSRLDTMRRLVHNTLWSDLLDSVTSLDPSIYHLYPGAGYRASRVPNLAFVGDAQGHKDPIGGKGIGDAVCDVDKLIAAVRDTGGNLSDAFMLYNRTQEEHYKKVFEATQKSYRMRMAFYTLNDVLSAIPITKTYRVIRRLFGEL